MKKRIGSRLYDTDTAERICSIDGGSLYQKRTRNREWFAVYDDGTVRPLDVYDPLDRLLMETGHDLPDLDKPEPQEYRVRVDADTYHQIADRAETDGCSMSQVVKKAILSYRAD